MKRSIIALLFTTCVIPFCSFSQNLVPNPSFELYQRLPDKEGNSINRSKNWIAPKFNSDYYHEDAERAVSAPKNRFGKQKPHSGKAYAGICTRTNFLEYVETKLNDTLIKDREYLVEFYISRAERSIGYLNEFGVLFTKKNIWGIPGRGITSKPQIQFQNKKGYKSKKKWIKLSAVYKAEGNECVMTIGHFNYDPADDKHKILCHYYIDDVSITLIEKAKDSTVTKPEKETPSEVFSPKLNESITLQNIFFESGKSELLPTSFPELDKLAKYLLSNPELHININGHTDNTGNEDQNKKLSEARAKSVSDYLITNGINNSRISYYGYGSSKPIASNLNEEGKLQNRRVEFTLYK